MTEFDHRAGGAHDTAASTATAEPGAGKRTLTEQLPVPRHEATGTPAPDAAAEDRPSASAPASVRSDAGQLPLQMLFGVQRAETAAPARDPAQVHAAAAHGIAGPGGPLPHLDQIQPLFGRHDVSHVQAHVGGAAAEGAGAMGAEAFATGHHVAFASQPSLHTAAHEAAHIVQQQGGVQLKGGVGEVGDQYERQADEVADRVVRGESAERVLDTMAPARSQGGAVQRAPAATAVQRSIGCHVDGTGAPQFQIDGARPAWLPHAQAIVLAAGQARCHIIGFEVIQNDLANILNRLLVARGPGAAAAPAAIELTALCDSLFVTPPPNPITVAMNVAKNALVAAIQALPAAPAVVTPAQRANLTTLSGTLLTHLNSCPDNLRPGDSAINAATSYSIDADFLPGTIWYHGPIHTRGVVPAAGIPPAGIVPLGPGGAAPAPAGTSMAGPFEAVRLTAAHEGKVYAYQNASTLPLSFVLSGGGGAVAAGTVAGQQLSSTQLPTVGGHPVIVMDPAGAGSPLVYH